AGMSGPRRGGGLATGRDQTSNAMAERNAKFPDVLRFLTERHLEDQLLRLLVQQEQSGSPGGDHARRRFDDHLQQPRVADWGSDRTGDGGLHKDSAHFIREMRVGASRVEYN